jgi:hypothetical protein
MFIDHRVADESLAASLDSICARQPFDALRANGQFAEEAATRSWAPQIEIFPPQGVTRRAASWGGMTAEFIESTVRARFEFRFRAPVHLLIV